MLYCIRMFLYICMTLFALYPSSSQKILSSVYNEQMSKLRDRYNLVPLLYIDPAMLYINIIKSDGLF